MIVILFLRLIITVNSTYVIYVHKCFTKDIFYCLYLRVNFCQFTCFIDLNLLIVYVVDEMCVSQNVSIFLLFTVCCN